MERRARSKHTKKIVQVDVWDDIPYISDVLKTPAGRFIVERGAHLKHTKKNKRAGRRFGAQSTFGSTPQNVQVHVLERATQFGCAQNVWWQVACGAQCTLGANDKRAGRRFGARGADRI